MTENSRSGEQAEAKRSIFSDHISALLAASVALLGSLFYFAGSQYVDTMARSLGFAGDVGGNDFQKTMADGASVIFNGRFLPYLAALAFIVWALVAALDFITDLSRLRTKVDGYRERTEKYREEFNSLKERFNIQGLSSLTLALLGITLFVRLQRLWFGVSFLSALVTLRSARGLLVAALLSVASLSSFWLILTAGKLEAEREASAIAQDLRTDCKRCRLFTVQGAAVVGIAVRQTPSGIVVAEREGASFLSTEGGLKISLPPRNTKALKPRP